MPHRHLQALALNVYSQPISQSTVKQLFSIYDGIMGPKRNKLSFATQSPNATYVRTRIRFWCGYAYFCVFTRTDENWVVRVPKPFFMPHHTTKLWGLIMIKYDDGCCANDTPTYISCDKLTKDMQTNQNGQSNFMTRLVAIR